MGGGGVPDDLEPIDGPAPDTRRRDVHVYVVRGTKVADPATAMALIERVG